MLRSRYDDGEARAVARYLLEMSFGLQMTDILCGATEQLPDDKLQSKINRLLDGEPVQYVTGTAEFCGRCFNVAPGVLIPRPETEELCRLVEEDERANGERNRHILDIGTGSGCIAITLALDIPGTQVEAWDISDEALAIARKNAMEHKAVVKFENVDILKMPPNHPNVETNSMRGACVTYDKIVSNPPYIVPSEASEMEHHVLCLEPGIALFAPENNPLLFYDAIAVYAMQALRPLGKLFFEINPLFAERLGEMLAGRGFTDITFGDDRFGRRRFAIATKPE